MSSHKSFVVQSSKVVSKQSCVSEIRNRRHASNTLVGNGLVTFLLVQVVSFSHRVDSVANHHQANESDECELTEQSRHQQRTILSHNNRVSVD